MSTTNFQDRYDLLACLGDGRIRDEALRDLDAIPGAFMSQLTPEEAIPRSPRDRGRLRAADVVVTDCEALTRSAVAVGTTTVLLTRSASAMAAALDGARAPGLPFVQAVTDEDAEWRAWLRSRVLVAVHLDRHAMTSAAGRRILFVDDEPKLRDVYQGMAELLFPGIEIVLAADGDEALELVYTSGAHLDGVITDRLMPRLDGPHFLARARPQLLHTTPVLIESNCVLTCSGWESMDACGWHPVFGHFRTNTSSAVDRFRDAISSLIRIRDAMQRSRVPHVVS